MLFDPQLSNYNTDFDLYFDNLESTDLFDQYKHNTSTMVDAFNHFAARGEEAENYRYAPDKWTVKDMLHHINDTERIFQYRALVAARQDEGVLLSSFDQDFYMAHSDTSDRSLADLLEEFRSIRQSSFYLFRGLDESAMNAVKTVAGYDFTARLALAFIIGHGWHHCHVLDEKYAPYLALR